METTSDHIKNSISEIDEKINKLIKDIDTSCDINILNRHSITEYLIIAKKDLKMAYKLNEIYKEKCECESNCK